MLPSREACQLNLHCEQVDAHDLRDEGRPPVPGRLHGQAIELGTRRYPIRQVEFPHTIRARADAGVRQSRAVESDDGSRNRCSILAIDHPATTDHPLIRLDTRDECERKQGWANASPMPGTAPALHRAIAFASQVASDGIV